MSNGAGIYDEDCGNVREKNNASGVLLIVLGGDKGNGFSIQAEGNIIQNVPEMLESIAKELRSDLVANS